MRPSRWLLAGALAVLALAAPARAGQVVYAHGSDLWVVNDDGSSPRQLLSAAQAGGPIGLDAAGDTGVAVDPAGNSLAIDVSTPGSSCAQNCPGLYTFAGGGLIRLSPPPAACPPKIACASEQVDPAVTADARVLYLSLARTSPPNCGGIYCVNNGGYLEQYYSRSIDGHDAPARWPLPPLAASDPQGLQPDFHGALAADPADPTQIAYTGNYLQGQDVRHGGGCGPQGMSDCFPLDIAAKAGAVNQIRIDDSFYYGLSFSPDGSMVAALETGDNKGIWVYPSDQSYTGTPSYTYALADPTQDQQGVGPLSLAIGGLTFAGPGAIVFSAQDNLWSLPARCWTAPATTPTATTPTATTPTASPPACTFPADAVQLTHDGTDAAPDTQPSWTASTVPIPADTSPVPVPPKPVDPLTALTASPKSVRAGSAVSLQVMLRAAARVRVTLVRHLGSHTKPRDVVAARLTVAGHTGVNAVKLDRRKLVPARYTAMATAGFRTRTASFTVRR